MDLVAFLTARETIIATAIVGAVLATAPSLRPVRARVGAGASVALVWTGYALTGASMLLMIVAGFLSGR